MSDITGIEHIASDNDEVVFEPSKKFLQAVYDTSPDLIFIYGKDKKLIDTNRNAEIQLQYSKSELLEFEQSQYLVRSKSKPKVAERKDIKEWCAIRKDGSQVTVELRAAKLPASIFINGYEACMIVTARDISERKVWEEKLLRLAHHDAVTGLVNRTLLEDRGRQAIHRAKRHQQAVALLYIDLDRFKTVNDNLGHHIGDKLLRAVSARVKAVLRDGDTFGRLSGDEFLVIAEEVSCRKDTETIADKILKTVCQPFGIEKHRLDISASIGISMYPAHGDDFPTLLRNADSAMYSAKELGRNRAKYFIEHALPKTPDDEQP